jgi:hypothetical protein
MTNGESAAHCASMLLHALAQGAGDVAVLRAGETPYLMGPDGRHPLAHNDLSVAALRSLMAQLLPEGERDELAAVGATRYDLPAPADLPDERFTVDAEIDAGGPVLAVRRLHGWDDDHVPHELMAATPIAVGDDTLLVPSAWDLWHGARAVH